VLVLFVDFLVLFLLWCLDFVVPLLVVWPALLAGGLAGGWAANVTVANANAMAAIKVFFIVFSPSPGGPF
jgi:hypothetical protein